MEFSFLQLAGLGPGSCIYFPQEQGSPVIPPGIGAFSNNNVYILLPVPLARQQAINIFPPPVPRYEHFHGDYLGNEVLDKRVSDGTERLHGLCGIHRSYIRKGIRAPEASQNSSILGSGTDRINYPKSSS
jgi:hypothetical protein